MAAGSSRVPAPAGQRDTPAPPAPRAAPRAAPRQRKRRRRGEAEGAAAGPPGPWGTRLPPELLARVFEAAVGQDGAVPLLCRAARVCRLWNDVASDPRLWRRVSLGGRGGDPSPRRPHPPTQGKVLGALRWLAESRFSLLQEFELSGWRSHVGDVLRVLSGHCPLLTSLSLRHCQVDPPALLGFLAVTPQLRELRLSCGPPLGPVLPALASGCCPELRLLELEAAPGGTTPPLPLPVERLQVACPHLKVLRLLNVAVAPQRCRLPPSDPPWGFPQLEELSLAPPGPPGPPSGVDNGLLVRLLHGSGRLRRLWLRGCARVTPHGLLQLPCPALEQLSLGLPCGAEPEPPPRPSAGGAGLVWRWRQSLRELDLAGRALQPPDLAQAIAALGPASPLRHLDLAATTVTADALSVLLDACPNLAYLDLSSCRWLPRGTKRPHRGLAEVRSCLQLLASHARGDMPHGHALPHSDGEPQNQEQPNEEPPGEAPPL